MSDSKKFKILSISGGGTRGVIPATIIQELEKEINIQETFDLVVGTSTGGIIATALGAGYKGKEIVNLYIDEVSNIFTSSMWHKITNVFSIKGPKYPAKGVVNTLRLFLGNKSISEAKIPFITTAYETIENDVKLFKSWKEEDHKYSFSDVALATSAAPTYLPSYQINDKNFIDGGIYANSPINIAWVEALKKGYKPEDIVILSLGTGKQPQEQHITHNWGIYEWLTKGNSGVPILEMTFEGIQDKDHYITNLLFPNVHYINPNINKFKTDETNTKKLLELHNIAKKVFMSYDTQEFLNKHIYM